MQPCLQFYVSSNKTANEAANKSGTNENIIRAHLAFRHSHRLSLLFFLL